MAPELNVHQLFHIGQHRYENPKTVKQESATKIIKRTRRSKVTKDLRARARNVTCRNRQTGKGGFLCAIPQGCMLRTSIVMIWRESQTITKQRKNLATVAATHKDKGMSQSSDEHQNQRKRKADRQAGEAEAVQCTTTAGQADMEGREAGKQKSRYAGNQASVKPTRSQERQIFSQCANGWGIDFGREHTVVVLSCCRGVSTLSDYKSSLFFINSRQ